MSTLIARAAGAAAALVALPLAALAQRPAPISPPDSVIIGEPSAPVGRRCEGLAYPGCGIVRFAVSGAFEVAQPVGEFRDQVGVSMGANFNGVVLARPGAALGLMASLGFISYGGETETVRVSAPVVGTFPARLHTSYTYFGMQVGPELAARSGRVRPYIGGTIGFGHFGSSSDLSIEDQTPSDEDDDRVELWSKDHQGDAVLATTGLGGIRLALGSRRSPFMLDVGARYVHNGRAEYVAEGGIVNNADGTTTVQVNRGNANFVSYGIGLSLGIGGRGGVARP